MKILISTICLLTLIQGFYGQNYSVKFLPPNDSEVMSEFMNMTGFEHFEFSLTSTNSKFINVFVDEYLNDSLIKSYDHVTESKRENLPKSMYGLLFPKSKSGTLKLKFYALAKGDTLEQFKFRIGGLEINKKSRINRNDFVYELKLPNELENESGARVELGKKIPLLYYATSVEENVDGTIINRFCNVPNIIEHKDLMKVGAVVKHYFIIGFQLLDNIE